MRRIREPPGDYDRGVELIEREAELATIGGALADVSAGDGRLVIFKGPAGIGKSALLGELVERATAAGIRALCARADELEQELDYGIARQLLDRPVAGGELGALSGPTAIGAAALGLTRPPADGALSPGAVTHGLYWLVAELAAERPVVLAIDDVQWSDGSSLIWLGYLARRLADLPVILTLSWRPGEVETADRAVERLATQPDARVLEPAPLTPAGVAALAGPGAPDAAVLHHATGGNPFLVTELSREGRTAATVEEMARADFYDRFRTLAIRLLPLGPDAPAMPEAVAVLGDAVELSAAAVLSGLPLDRAAAAADVLGSADILAPDRLLGFAHPLVREAVRSGIGSQRRAVLHREAARHLHADRAPAVRVAAQLRLAAPAADNWAAVTLTAAGRAAVGRGALHEGIALLERARDEPPAAADRAGVLTDLGAALSLVGRPEASEVLREAIAIDDDPGRRLRSRVALGRLVGSADLARGVREIEAAAAEADAVDPDHALAIRGTLLAIRLAALGGGGELPAGLPPQPRTLPGRTPGERLLLGSLAYHDALLGEVPAANCAALAERALGGGVLLDDGLLESFEVIFIVSVTHLCDRLDLARGFLETWLARAQAAGSELGFAYASAGLAACLLLAGEVGEAEAHAESARAASELIGQPSFLVSAIGTFAERGRFEEAESMRALDTPDLVAAWPLTATTLMTQARLRSVQGRWREAASAALAAGERLAARGTPSPGVLWRAEAAVALAALGELGEARRLAAEQLPIARAWGTARAVGLALRAQGMAEDGERGIALLREAATVLEDSPARLELIRTLVDLGATLRRRKQRVAGREVLRRALDLAARSGATVLEARAREEIAATGARPRGALLSGAQWLTPSERRIAVMAAKGRSNPEIAQALFVSRKTVETHLGACYRKLDIASRQQLGQALAT